MSIAGISTSRKRQGFTLFELLVVIAILAIVAGLVVPNIDMNIRATGSEAVRELLSDVFRECRTHARLTRKDVVIDFGKQALSWTGQKQDLDYPDGVEFQGVLLATDVDEPEPRLIINRLGITAASILRFEIDGKTYSFRVSPVVRDIRVAPGFARFDDFAN